MKTIYKLIIKSYIGPFVATLCIALFILMMQFLWKYIDDLVGKGLDGQVIAKLLLYAGLTLVPMALPLAILISSIMTFGNLGEHYELVALKSSGLSLYRIMYPLIVISILISVVAFYFSNIVLPYANLKMGALLYDVHDQKATLKIKNGVFYKGIDGYSIRVDSKEKDGKTVHGILIYDHTAGVGNNKVIMAKSGIIEMSEDKSHLLITLKDGSSYEETLKNNDLNLIPTLTRSVFEEQLIRFDLSGFKLKRTDESLFKNNYQMLNLNQLSYSIDSLNKKRDSTLVGFTRQLTSGYYAKSIDFSLKTDSMKQLVYKCKNAKEFLSSLKPNERIGVLETAANQIRSAKAFSESIEETMNTDKRAIAMNSAELHRKFTLSFACLVLFFIGAPLGAIIRKGGLGMPVVVSVLFFVVFHVLSITGEKLVKQSALPAYQGMWIASAVLFPVGVFLTYKATGDSALFDGDVYKRVLRKINPFAKKLTSNKQ